MERSSILSLPAKLKNLFTAATAPGLALTRFAGFMLALAAVPAQAQPATGILLERWDGIAGNLVSNLTSNPAYPNSPTTRSYPNIFEIPTNAADNYGTRIRTVITPPTTGSYTFFIAGDDYCELWFAPVSNPGAATRIAHVPGWATARQWTKYPEQTSAPVSLSASTSYYLETRHKEAAGGDNLAVGWQGPGITGEAERPIPGSRLRPWPLAPAITAHPANAQVNQGQAATFTVVATGTYLTYQWRKNGANIAGATAASYLTPAAAPGDNGAQFSVVVSNAAGTVTSNNAVLTVIVPPVITTQPGNQTVNVGQTATFSINASGTAPSYQWRKNGANIPGANAPSYTTPPTVSGDNGAQFSVVVSNSAGTATSNNAVLTVVSIPVITTHPASQTVNVGQTATFSVVATGSAPLTYQWRRNGVSIGGATGTSYTTPPAVAGDNGALFSVVVTNPSGSTASNNATLTVITPPAISTQPAAATVNVGQTATFGVVATGTAPLAYQWRKNGVNIGGATASSYATPAAVLADNGARFTVVVTNAGGSVISAEAVLTVVFIAPNNKKLAVSGELVDASGNPLGFPTAVTVDAVIRLFNDDSGGTNLYSEEFRAAAGKGIRVENGLFTARLGEGATSQNLQQVVTVNASLWVEITIDDGTPDVLSPRTPLTASAYALGGTPALAPSALSGDGDPNAVGVQAAAGATYVNTSDNTTWFKLSSGWKLMD